jgi:hypothetical protein
MDTLLQVFFSGGLVAFVLYILKLLHDIHEAEKKAKGLDY